MPAPGSAWGKVFMGTALLEPARQQASDMKPAVTLPFVTCLARWVPLAVPLLFCSSCSSSLCFSLLSCAMGSRLPWRRLRGLKEPVVVKGSVCCWLSLQEAWAVVVVVHVTAVHSAVGSPYPPPGSAPCTPLRGL